MIPPQIRKRGLTVILNQDVDEFKKGIRGIIRRHNDNHAEVVFPETSHQPIIPWTMLDLPPIK